MEFYKIINPTTKQIFDAIISKEYTPIESIIPKAKQIYILLRDYFNSEVYVTFDGVTNSGGVPIFYGANESMHDIASDINDNWYELSEEEQQHQIELLSWYARPYTDIFNL
jgi:Mg2+/Co2+ transporter CorC